MKQKLHQTLNFPQSPTYSSQKTTQTSAFFPIKTTRTYPIPVTSVNPLKLKINSPKTTDLSKIHDKFRSIIEEKTLITPINKEVSLEIKQNRNNSENPYYNNNTLTTPRLPKKKKLTFNETKKQETTPNVPIVNLAKAINIESVITKNIEEPVEPENYVRIATKSNTFLGKLSKNPLTIHTKNISLPNEEMLLRKTFYTPKEGLLSMTESKEYGSIYSYRNADEKSQKKKMYQSQSQFLKKIAKIHKPKFEAKIDFLNKKDLHQNYKNFLFAQGVLTFIKFQCKSIDSSLNIYKFIEMSKDTYTYILHLFPLVRSAINSLKNRNDLDKAFHQIETKCQQSRNMSLTLKTLLLHAKIILMMQDVYKAIIIYKNCKKIAISCQLLPFLISCYKGLGRCFQFLKQYSLALTYFSKMLQCSWKLKDKDHEILAYDLIGMQFYYLGDLERSKYYHQRMVEGEFEPENSNVRKLAVTNFLQKKSKTSKDFNKISDNPLSQFTDNLLDSSDEETFQLPNPSNNRRNASEPDLKRTLLSSRRKSKYTKKNVFIPGKNLVAMMEKRRKEKLIGSIRTTDEFKRLLSKNISEGKKTGNSYVGEKQEKVLLSHLSPNRELMSYQLFKPAGLRNINFYNINDHLYENEELAVELKIKEKLKRYAEKLLLTINKLKAIFSKSCEI